MDVSGEHQLDILHSVYKQRLRLDGTLIEEEAEQYQMGGEGEEGGEEGRVREGEVMVAGDNQCGRYSTMAKMTSPHVSCIVAMELKMKTSLVVRRVKK